MKTKTERVSDELRAEYEFDYSKAVRGKYHKQLIKEGTNIIVIDPDVIQYFPDHDSVNEALRSLLPIVKRQAKKIVE